MLYVNYTFYLSSYQMCLRSIWRSLANSDKPGKHIKMLDFASLSKTFVAFWGWFTNFSFKDHLFLSVVEQKLVLEVNNRGTNGPFRSTHCHSAFSLIACFSALLCDIYFILSLSPQIDYICIQNANVMFLLWIFKLLSQFFSRFQSDCPNCSVQLGIVIGVMNS